LQVKAEEQDGEKMRIAAEAEAAIVVAATVAGENFLSASGG